MKSLTQVTTFLTLYCPVCRVYKKLKKEFKIYPNKDERGSKMLHIMDCLCNKCSGKEDNEFMRDINAYTY